MLAASKDFIVDEIVKNKAYEKIQDIEIKSKNQNIVDQINAIKKETRQDYIKNGGADVITEKVYDLLKVYAKEVGTSKHIEDYLKKTFEIEIPPESMKKDVKYPKLYKLVSDIIFYHDIETVEDFLKLTNIKYLWFVPEEKRDLILNAYKYKIDITKDVKTLFDEYMPSRLLTSSSLDKVISEFIPSHKFFKFKKTYATKKVTLIQKAKENAFTLDILPLIPDIKILVKRLKEEKENKELYSMIGKDKSALDLYEANLIKKALKKVVEGNERYSLYKSLTKDNKYKRAQDLLEQENQRLARQRMFEESNRNEIERQKRELEQMKEQARQAQISADEVVARRLQEQFDEEARIAREAAQQREQQEYGVQPMDIDDMPPNFGTPDFGSEVTWNCNDCGGTHTTSQDRVNLCPMIMRN